MPINRDAQPEDFVPPVFWTPPTGIDFALLALQCGGRRFDPAIVRYGAKRCKYGHLQAIVCHPLSNGAPFPTLFWLTCPWLDKKCGALESDQKIAELEALFRANAEEVAAYHAAYATLRVKMLAREEREKLRAEQPAMWRSISETGIGGIRYQNDTSGAKCLHLQTAAWLGMGEHPASDWLSRNLGALDCENNFCKFFNEEK